MNRKLVSMKILNKLIFILLLVLLSTYQVSALEQFVFEKSNPKLGNVSLNDPYFNLKDYGLLTTVKNQSSTNSCWIFATNASIESNLLMNDYGFNDLSEAHLEMSTQNTYVYNRNTFLRKINTGGNYNIAASYLMNSWGPVKESELSLYDLQNLYNNNVLIDENKIINVKPSVDVNSIAFIGNNGKCSKDTINDIKEYLITNGALAATIYTDNSDVFKKYYYYDGKEFTTKDGKVISKNQNVNHGVTIVGWDDTISKDKFSQTNPPSTNGAFIIKNSYGEKMSIGGINAVKTNMYRKYHNNINISSINDITDSMLTTLIAKEYDVSPEDISYRYNEVYINIGNAGYNYISYDDIYVCNSVVGFFDTSTNVEDYSYYYDYLGYNAVYQLTNQNKLYLMSIFNKQSLENEKLEEVSLYFPKINEKYEVYFANGKEKDVNKMVKIGEGVSKFIGYATLNLNNKPIISNDKYTIIIKINDKDVNIGVSTKSSGNYLNMELIPDVQFISRDGKNYSDVTKLANNQFHLTMKAYNNKATKDNLIEDVNPELGNIPTLDVNINTNKKYTFKETFNKILPYILIVDVIIIIIVMILIFV